jgi:hypothetical protein
MAEAVTRRGGLGASAGALSLRRVFETWWPLSASWLLMGLELPALGAVMARLHQPTVHLAAFGGVVFPVALLIEAPIIQLLAASTALSRDFASYAKLRRFTHVAGCGLTLAHGLFAFTPLFDLVVELLHAPLEVREPARLGLRIMTPWTWAIAFRRFNQGVLIRHGHSRAVGTGTVLRMAANFSVLLVGLGVGDGPGIVVASSALVAGVLAEAGYTALRVRPVLRHRLKPAPTVEPRLTARRFWPFYLPLALTSLLHLLMEPIGAAALGRMPRPLESLAAWAVVYGLVFTTQSLGIAFNEVVVALVGEPGGAVALRRFALWLSALASLPLLSMVIVPPLSRLCFVGILGLPEPLAELAQRSLLFALPLPGLVVAHSWFQGVLVHSRRTRAIPESLGLYVTTAAGLSWLGVLWGGAPGLFVMLVALTAGATVQALWLGRRSREARQRLLLG